ncbi:MAG: GNAT family N-acetyltransferase [Chitinophagaceae bacterium]|nr:MAG: GNAT family N-acetyltransferase [Chitinophagaceae bacterium]
MTVEMKIPQTIQIDDHLSLVLIEKSHASALLAAIDRNRDWLRKWLPWVDYMRTMQNVQSYIDRCKEQYIAGTDVGFVIFHQLHRIEIRCATGNDKSAAVAERLGFLKEGVLREAELVNGKQFDLAVFSQLHAEWEATTNQKMNYASK